MMSVRKGDDEIQIVERRLRNRNRLRSLREQEEKNKTCESLHQDRERMIFLLDAESARLVSV